MTLPSEKLITVNDRGARAATTFGSVAAVGGNMVFIKKLTASSSSTLTFHDGVSSVVLDSTYKEYLFTFNNIHPATDNVEFRFQVNKAGASGFNETITSSAFQATHAEADGSTAIAYRTDYDQAQGTNFQPISNTVGNGNDESISGSLHLFNPSSTTFVKHYMARTNTYYYGDITVDMHHAGYINETDAIDEIQFKMSSGNIDAGDICLYGIL
tara:strand:- start:197 stop:835 length:639 start_codon:yes stop_codon:yes gene_type:complete